jgi:hypothetical protein
MQITVQIHQDDLVQALADVADRIFDKLADNYTPREPRQVISDAIRDGLAKAISEKLSNNWGGELLDAIAEKVTKAMTDGIEKAHKGCAKDV